MHPKNFILIAFISVLLNGTLLQGSHVQIHTTQTTIQSTLVVEELSAAALQQAEALFRQGSIEAFTDIPFHVADAETFEGLVSRAFSDALMFLGNQDKEMFRGGIAKIDNTPVGLIVFAKAPDKNNIAIVLLAVDHHGWNAEIAQKLIFYAFKAFPGTPRIVREIQKTNTCLSDFHTEIGFTLKERLITSRNPERWTLFEIIIRPNLDTVLKGALLEAAETCMPKIIDAIYHEAPHQKFTQQNGETAIARTLESISNDLVGADKGISLNTFEKAYVLAELKATLHRDYGLSFWEKYFQNK